MGRFAQPDPIIAEPGSSQGYNRYSYVGNNPINYIDPSGHLKDCSEDKCTPKEMAAYWAPQFNIEFVGKWSKLHMLAVLRAIIAVGAKLMSIGKGGSAAEAFNNAYGETINFIWTTPGQSPCGQSEGGCTLQTDPRNISFVSMSGDDDYDGDRSNNFTEMVMNVVHELGHAYDLIHHIVDGGFNDTYVEYRDNILRKNPSGELLWQQHQIQTTQLKCLPICLSHGCMMLGIQI